MIDGEWFVAGEDGFEQVAGVSYAFANADHPPPHFINSRSTPPGSRYSVDLTASILFEREHDFEYYCTHVRRRDILKCVLNEFLIPWRARRKRMGISTEHTHFAREHTFRYKACARH